MAGIRQAGVRSVRHLLEAEMYGEWVFDVRGRLDDGRAIEGELSLLWVPQSHTYIFDLTHSRAVVDGVVQDSATIKQLHDVVLHDPSVRRAFVVMRKQVAAHVAEDPARYHEMVEDLSRRA